MRKSIPAQSEQEKSIQSSIPYYTSSQPDTSGKSYKYSTKAATLPAATGIQRQTYMRTEAIRSFTCCTRLHVHVHTNVLKISFIQYVPPCLCKLYIPSSSTAQVLAFRPELRLERGKCLRKRTQRLVCFRLHIS